MIEAQKAGKVCLLRSSSRPIAFAAIASWDLASRKCALNLWATNYRR